MRAPIDDATSATARFVDWVHRHGCLTRSDLARLSGLSTSAVHRRVDRLVEQEVLTETGGTPSRGGRPSRQLAINGSLGVVGAATINAVQTQLRIADLAGRVLAEAEFDHDAGDGPEPTVTRVWQRLDELLRDRAEAPLWSVCLSVPAPISQPDGQVTFPSFMPSWHRALPGQVLAQFTEVPVIVDNDANLVALAESRVGGQGMAIGNLLAIGLGNASAAESSVMVHCTVVSVERQGRSATSRSIVDR